MRARYLAVEPCYARCDVYALAAPRQHIQYIQSLATRCMSRQAATERITCNKSKSQKTLTQTIAHSTYSLTQRIQHHVLTLPSCAQLAKSSHAGFHFTVYTISS